MVFVCAILVADWLVRLLIYPLTFANKYQRTAQSDLEVLELSHSSSSSLTPPFLFTLPLVFQTSFSFFHLVICKSKKTTSIATTFPHFSTSFTSFSLPSLPPHLSLPFPFLHFLSLLYFTSSHSLSPPLFHKIFSSTATNHNKQTNKSTFQLTKCPFLLLT